MSAAPPTPESLLDAPSVVAQMRPALVRYFRRKSGSAAETEDLAQEVLLRALTHAHWTSFGQAKGYIFRIAVNCWHDRQRRRRVQGTAVDWDEAELEAPSAENAPERVLVIQEELIQLIRALDELSERTRMVLMLVKLEKMKIATVAEMLGISVSAVGKHLAKGLAHLARLRNEQDRP